MLTEEVKKRIYTIALITAAIIGALFLIWAIFLNRGKLTFIAKAPYVYEIKNLKTVACPADTCTEEVAPGEYSIVLKKDGYRDLTRQVNVPIFGEYKEEIKFEFIPLLSAVSAEEFSNFKTSPALTAEQISKLPSDKIFYDQNYICYLAINPENQRQTLYLQPLENGILGPAKAVTSFIRDFKTYQIIPGIENQEKIAIIDNGGAEATLYFIDLKSKSRTNILSFPYIDAIKWLPDSNNVLFEGREKNELVSSLYLYDSGKRQPVKLNISASLKNVGVLSGSEFVIVTAQPIIGQSDGTDLDGKIVAMEEAEASPNSVLNNGILLTTPVLNIIDYSMIPMQGRLIKATTELPLPESVKLNDTKKGLYLIYSDKAYLLTFAD
jgi:hypothetical protein